MHRLLSFVYSVAPSAAAPSVAAVRQMIAEQNHRSGLPPLRAAALPWLLVVAPPPCRSRKSVFVSCLCSFLQKYLLFRLFYTQKRTKCTLFCIFCAKYLAVSKKCITFAPQSKIIECPTEGGTLAKSLIKAKL